MELTKPNLKIIDLFTIISIASLVPERFALRTIQMFNQINTTKVIKKIYKARQA